MVMSNCLSCGHERHSNELKCSQCLRIFRPGDVKQALMFELKQFIARVSRQGLFALFIVIAFIFALMVTVL